MRVLVIVALLLSTYAFAQGPERVFLQGKVVAPDGKPVAGARVAGTYEWKRSSSTFNDVTTAADGSFTIRVANPEDPRVIRVLAAAKGYSNATEIKARVGDTITLVLRPTIDFTVQIVDGAKLPVKTATVTIAKDSFSTVHPLVGVPQRVDAHGKVTFKGVNDADALDLIVKAPGYLEVTWPHAQLAQPLEIGIVRGAMMRARILDAATGAPVQVCRIATAMGQQATTDPKGNFAVPVPYGRVSVLPQCAEYGTDYDLGPLALTIDFTETSANQLHVVRARRNQIVRVRVVDAKGKPVAKANVFRTQIPPNPDDIAILRHGPPIEYDLTDDTGEVVFAKSSMDRFTLTIEGYRVRQDVRFADLRGTVVLVAK